MGAFSEYLKKLAIQRGTTIETDSEVAEIKTTGTKATGVRLQDGREFDAPIVISNATHHVTFKNLMD